MNNTKTYIPPVIKAEERNWYIIDLAEEEKTLGRVATTIAHYLVGKNRVDYTPHQDRGDYIIVINASKAKFTGDKENRKNYYWHTGYRGGIKSMTLAEMRAKDPEQIVINAVKGMIKTNRLKKERLARLIVYSGEEYKQKSKKPKKLEIK